MPAAAASIPHFGPELVADLDVRRRTSLGLLCLCATVASLAARWIPDLAARTMCGVLISAVLLACSLASAKFTNLPQVRPLLWALFIFALVQLLNDSLPHVVASYLLRESPTSGNPLASTVSGSLVIQLLETALAVVPILVVARLASLDLRSLYVTTHPKVRWLLFASVSFIALYAFIATIPLRPGSPIQQLLPLAADLSVQRVLALTPALVVLALSNGLQEELLFRGLFLQRYTVFLGAGAANVLQAAVFTVAHVDVTYTPMLLLFLIALVFPLGLLAGYLMRASNSVLVPAIVHGGLDLLIYLGFLVSAVG